MATQLAGRSLTGSSQSHTTLRARSSSGGMTPPVVDTKLKASRSEHCKRGSMSTLASSKHVSFATCTKQRRHEVQHQSGGWGEGGGVPVMTHAVVNRTLTSRAYDAARAMYRICAGAKLYFHHTDASAVTTLLCYGRWHCRWLTGYPGQQRVAQLATTATAVE